MNYRTLKQMLFKVGCPRSLSQFAQCTFPEGVQFQVLNLSHAPRPSRPKSVAESLNPNPGWELVLWSFWAIWKKKNNVCISKGGIKLGLPQLEADPRHSKEGKWCSNHSWERKQLPFPLFPFPKKVPMETHNYKKGETIKSKMKSTRHFAILIHFCYKAV